MICGKSEAWESGGNAPEGAAVAGHLRFRRSDVVGFSFFFVSLVVFLGLICADCPSSGLTVV